jgi:hypothetical protein
MQHLLLAGPATVLLLPAPTPIKLDWDYDNSHRCEVAFHNGYMVKAENDFSASNPFEEDDCNWPIAVYDGSSIKTYDKAKGACVAEPISRFNDAQLIHNQIAIATAFGATIPQLFDDWGLDDEAVRYCFDADTLRFLFESEQSYFFEDARKSDWLEVCKALYDLLDIPAYCTTTQGSCQGDWAEVLVVATPEAQAAFGCKDVTSDQLESTADLYGYWARGKVYGFTLWAPVFDEDGEIEDWDQLDDSCWGYYGDHHESGLEEAALSSLPDEPVRLPDSAMQEDA